MKRSPGLVCLGAILSIVAVAVVASRVGAQCAAKGEPVAAVEFYCEAISEGNIGALSLVLAEDFGMDYLPRQRGSMTISKAEHIRGAVTAIQLGGDRVEYWTSGSATVAETGADAWHITGLTLHRSVESMLMDPVAVSFDVSLSEIDGQQVYEIAKIDLYFD